MPNNIVSIKETSYRYIWIIEVISAVNKGATFICTMPLKRPLIDDNLHDDYTIDD